MKIQKFEIDEEISLVKRIMSGESHDEIIDSEFEEESEDDSTDESEYEDEIEEETPPTLKRTHESSVNDETASKVFKLFGGCNGGFGLRPRYIYMESKSKDKTIRKVKSKKEKSKKDKSKKEKSKKDKSKKDKSKKDKVKSKKSFVFKVL